MHDTVFLQVVETLESGQATLEQKDGEAASEGEEATPISYDYEQLKSKPEMVNVSTDNMLQLLYPQINLIYTCT